MARKTFSALTLFFSDPIRVRMLIFTVVLLIALAAFLMPGMMTLAGNSVGGSTWNSAATPTPSGF